MTPDSPAPPDPLPPARRRRSWLPRVRLEGFHGPWGIAVTWLGREFVHVPTILFLLALVTIPLCLLSSVLTLPAVLVAFWPWFAGAMEHPLARAAAVAGLVLFAGCLYVLRQFRRVAYGYGEVAVGVLGLWAALSRLDADRMAVGLGIAAGVYVVVRGLANVEDGLKERRAAERKPPPNAVRPAPPAAPAPPEPPVTEPGDRPPDEPTA